MIRPITQQWQTGNGDGTAVTHSWATFTYSALPVNPTFATGLTNFGPPSGTVLKVLNKVMDADGSATQFEYNSYGQVSKINNYAADGHPLNYTFTNLQTVSDSQADCPRLTETHSWVENFNGVNGVPAETVVKNRYLTGQPMTNGGVTENGTLLEVELPDDTAHHHVSKTLVGASGWREGLPLMTEDWANENNTGAAKKRWTWTQWTQDDTALGSALNPRVTETKVGDTTNIKRTTVDYYLNSGTNISIAGLVAQVKVYDRDQTTVLKRTTTDYNFANAYISRNIVGLPTLSKLYDGQDNLLAQVGYQYDEGALNDSSLNQNISPVQHDNTNYGAGFNSGRGNQTSVTRFDATGATASVTSQTKYNTAGLPVAQIDPAGRTVKIDYADSFNDGGNGRGTFAYPTTLTTPGSQLNSEVSSTVKYRYDLGLNVWAQSPPPVGQTTGKTSERIFDGLGRLQKEIIDNTGVYTRYEYPPNQIQSKVYTTMTDTNGNGIGDAADEVLSETFTDGAGRILRTQTPMSWNSSGNPATWSGTATEYDILGQVQRQTVPTEVNAGWGLAGDDVSRGWLWTSQEYDWKGRVTRKINTDGTDQLISYDGCGCTGIQTTTIQSESVPKNDGTGQNGRRTEKVYTDILGRDYQTELLNWNGTVYSSTHTDFNGRDQALSVKQYAGAVGSAAFQETTQIFDGHGRLKTVHQPEMDPGAVRTYNYQTDDRISSVTDARGAVTTYAYDDPRGLLTDVAYILPTNSGIPGSANVSYSYDNLGNRTQMTDGVGSVSYQYTQLSQLSDETRHFTDNLPNAPQANGTNSFNIHYTYGLAGNLSSVTDPFGAVVNYGYDQIGRLQSVTGSSFGGVTTYAANPNYRAWGGLKQLDYGDGTRMQMTYNNRLQADHYELNRLSQNYMVLQKNYEYYQDGSLKYVQDVNNPIFDRRNLYDFAGRIKEAKSGAEARGQTASTPLSNSLPYRQSYQYDGFSNITQRNNLHWGIDYWYGYENNLNYTYQNNRIQNFGFAYDADGRQVITSAPDENSIATYEASGRLAKLESNGTSQIFRQYDGDGRESKRIKNIPATNGNGWQLEQTIYYIRSVVFGGAVLSEVEATGRKSKTFVRAAGTELGWQSSGYYNSNEQQSVFFEHSEASGMSRRTTTGGGYELGGESWDGAPVESDPLGNNMGLETPYIEPIREPGEPDSPLLSLLGEESPTYVNGQRLSCTLDGLSIGCSRAQGLLGHGAAEIDFRQTDSFLLTQLGIIAQRVVPGRINVPTPPGGHNDEAYATLDRYEYYVFGSNWGSSGQSGQCGERGKPCPKPAPTPTPVPTPTPKPYPNCYTFFQLIYENTYVKNKINQLWAEEASLAATFYARPDKNGKFWAGETAGVLFFDESAYTITFNEYEGWEPADNGKPPTPVSNYLDQLKNFKEKRKQSGLSDRILLSFHTHPPEAGGTEAFSKGASPGDPEEITRSIYGGESIFGIVIYGQGKFKVFGRSRYEVDDETLKRTCINIKP